MSKPVCYLICILLFDLFLLNVQNFYIFDFLAPAFAFFAFCEDKKRAFFWLLGLNLFVAFMMISYILNSEFELAISLFTRVNLILTLVLSLLLGKDQYFLAKAMFELKMPQKIVAIMMISSKLFDELLREAYQIPRTLKARGVVLKVSLFTYKAYANLIGKMIVGSLDRSFEIFNTMKVRGFRGKVAFLASQKASLSEIMLLLLVVFGICFRIFKFFG